jgi:hypothetical protein
MNSISMIVHQLHGNEVRCSDGSGDDEEYYLLNETRRESLASLKQARSKHITLLICLLPAGITLRH